MNRRKKILLFLVAFLGTVGVLYGSLSLLTGTQTVYAAEQNTNASIQQIENKLDVIESQLAAVEQSMKKDQNAITDAESAYKAEQERKALLDQKLALVAESIAANQELIAAYEEEIAQKEADIQAKQRDIASQYSNVTEWMRLDYENSPANYLGLIFSTESFADFLSSAEMFSSMMEYQTAVMNELNADLVQLKEEKEVLGTYRATLAKSEEKLVLQKQNYEQLIKESASYMENLENTISKYENSLAASQQQKQELIASRKDLNAKLEKELEKLAQQNAVYVGGKYIWPMNAQKYKRVSSPYGWRNLYGVQDFHLGIDIPCDYGADIWAANAGNVVVSAWHYSYGYYVVVDHGGGQSTLYAHCSQLTVQVGQKVKQGDVIGKAGSTGSSYGVHLHFEVRLNGKTVDPLQGYVGIPK